MPKSLFKRLFHWGPFLAVSLVICITSSAAYCHLQWWPIDRPYGLLDLALFFILSSQCLINLVKAAHIGPGYVNLKWKPDEISDQTKLQYCSICEGYKAPRSHHCRKCNRCVLKMDHHCPWINNCVGHFNQLYFIKFLLFAVLGCLHASFILGASIYRAIFRVWYLYYGTGDEPIVELALLGLFTAIFSFGLAVGVVLAVGFLLVVQMRSVFRNRSGIEDYIINKALHRPRDVKFIYPYDLGWKENFKQLFIYKLKDGFSWPIVDGCDQFTFTLEQLQQKEAKRQILVEYHAVEKFGGSWFFCWLKFGCKIFLCQPLAEETRLKIQTGDRVLVSRWKRHWLYGQIVPKHHDEDSNVSISYNIKKGWFPRRCVVELEGSECVSDNDSENKNDESGKHKIRNVRKNE